MPCMNDGPHPETDWIPRAAQIAACWAIGKLEDAEVDMSDMPEEAVRWWQHHEASETDRVKREALAKLSRRERRLLGLL